MKAVLKLAIFAAIMLAMFSCSPGRAVDAVDAVGNAAEGVITIDLEQMVQRAGRNAFSQLSSAPLPAELKALAALRGVDRSCVVVVSYSASKSAVVFAVDSRSALRRSLSRLGSDAVSDEIFEARHIVGSEKAYFVTDTAWLWMVESAVGASEAIAKVKELRAYRADSLAPWKQKVLRCREMMGGVVKVGDNYAAIRASLPKSVVPPAESAFDFRAECRDSDGAPALWLPSESWHNISRGEGRIDPHDAFSLVCGAVVPADVAALMPRSVRRSLLRGFDDYTHSLGPISLSVKLDSLSPYDLTGAEMFFSCVLPSSEQASEAATALTASPFPLMDVTASSCDSVLTLTTPGALPVRRGTSYAGYKAAAVLNLSSQQLSELAGRPMPPLSAVLYVHGSVIDFRADFYDTTASFPELLIRLLLPDE